jgi:hypothetical protein
MQKMGTSDSENQMPKMSLPSDVKDQAKDLNNWRPALSLSDERPHQASKRQARTFRDERFINGLDDVGAYAEVNKRIHVCLPIFDYWFLSQSKVA